jgi:hypothetical protein
MIEAHNIVSPFGQATAKVHFTLVGRCVDRCPTIVLNQLVHRIEFPLANAQSSVRKELDVEMFDSVGCLH